MVTRGEVKELSRDLMRNLNNLSKPRIDLIALFIFSIVKSSTINLSKIAICMDNEVKTGSNYRRLQRFISQINWSNTSLTVAILKWIGLDNNLTLLIDRTNWEFGQKKINILFISVLYEGYSIPLGWSLLNKKGNSNQGDRWNLLNKIIEKIGHSKILQIVGDREFCGTYWYKYLKNNNIRFVIRIKSNQKVFHNGSKISVKSIVESNTRRGQQSNNKLYKFNGLNVYVSGFRFKNDKNKLEYLIILSCERIKNVSQVYGERWQIESMFKNMKSNGFNLEQTHVKKDSRLETLIGLVSISYIWMIKAGLYLKKKEPKIFKVKIHGRPARSVFRAGLDHVLRVLITNNSKELAIIIKFLSCT